MHTHVEDDHGELPQSERQGEAGGSLSYSQSYTEKPDLIKQNYPACLFASRCVYRGTCGDQRITGCRSSPSILFNGRLLSAATQDRLDAVSCLPGVLTWRVLLCWALCALWGLNSDSHACCEVTSPPGLSLQPSNSYVSFFKFTFCMCVCGCMLMP